MIERTPHVRGFALPAALFAMVVVGAVVTGGFYVAAQEDRISAGTAGAKDAFYIAEQGIERVMGTWSRNDFQSLDSDDLGELDDDVTVAGTIIGRYEVDIRRLDTETFLITSTGWPVSDSRYNAASRQVARVVRTELWDIPMNSALYVYGKLDVSGSSEIEGEDLDDGACHPDGEDEVPGVVTSKSGNVTVKGNGDIDGDPDVLVDPDMDPGSLVHYGDQNFATLAAMADKVVSNGNPPATAPSVTAGVCNQGLLYNWGDPLNANQPCSTYYPIIYSTAGTLKLQGGVGQGILLVEGDLQASGGFTFHGIVIVKGVLSTTGTGAHFNGVVLVNSDSVALNSTASKSAGNSIIQYSSCSAMEAMGGHLRSKPLASRSWFDFSAAGAALP